MEKRAGNKGFTLMEMLIVIAVIAILIAIAIPLFTSQLDNAKRATDEANARSAYAAALAQYMTDGASGSSSYVFDAASGGVATSAAGVAGYGQWDKPADYEVGGIAVSGVANNGTANAVTVQITDGAVTSVRWGGNDLTTAAGRRQEDIDNMHSISTALKTAMESGTLWQAKNYVQVAVFKDGTMAYFQDGRGNAEADVQTIKDALSAAGLNTDVTNLYSTDAKWKNGYVVHFEKNGNTYYKAISESENENHEIVWNWWNKPSLNDEDLVN